MACQIKKQNEKITEVLASNGATSILWDQLSGLTFLNDAQREDIYVNAQSIKNAVKDENGEPILMIQRTDVIHQNLGIGEVYTTDFTDAIMRNQGDTYSVGFIMSDNVEELETAEKTIPKQITDLFRKTTNSKAKVNKVKVNGIDNYVTTANVKNVFSINPNEDNTHAGFIIDKVRRGVLKLKTYQEKEKGLEAVQEDIADYPTEGDPQQQEDTSRINAYTVKTVWNKNRNIQFTGTTKVKNAEDVAEIMKQLENKTVEHAFAVHVDEKGDSYIQFLSIGGQTRTVIDPTLVLSGVTKFKTKKVYLVHNHPSGSLQPSQADLAITNKIREGLNPLKIDLEHVIIDTYKKSYVHIKSDNTFTVNKRGERELKDELEVYDITDKEFISEPMGKITQPDDVFKFIQNLRFSALPKRAVLLLDNGNNIIGNYILQKGVDLKEITDLIGEIGGVNGIILYGNYSDTVETNSLKVKLEKLDIRVLDDVTVGSNGNSVVEYYVSMNSRGLLSEHQEKYNTNEVNEPFASDYNNQQLLAPRLSREAQEQTVTIQDIGVVNGKRVIAASLAGQRVGSLTLVEQDGNFVTDTISVSEGYRGLGIAGEMYLEAANVLDRPIMSDMYRTEEAEAVWDKLFLEGKARKTSNGRYLITKEVSEVEQTQSEITEFVHSQLEKAGLVDEYYLMTNEQIEAELKRRGYSDDIVRQVVEYKEKFSQTIYPTGQETFVSNALTGISKLNLQPSTPSVWVKKIAESGGKGTNQELEWIGLEDYLNEWMQENNAKSVPQEVVEQYINDNQIEIVEVSKREFDENKSLLEIDRLKAERRNLELKYLEPLSKSVSEFIDKYNKIIKEIENVDIDSESFIEDVKKLYEKKEKLISDFKYTEYVDITPQKASTKKDNWVTVVGKPYYKDNPNYIKEAQELDNLIRIKEEEFEELSNSQPKYSEYQLEGGENYREVLLTLPKKKGQDYAEKMRNKYGRDLDPMQIYEKMSESERETQAKLNKESEVAYKSEHWDETNILAHIRINERTLPNGERVMFIEEVQSDWAQEGKRTGFDTGIDMPVIEGESIKLNGEVVGSIKKTPFDIWMGEGALKNVEENPETLEIYKKEWESDQKYIVENFQTGERLNFSSKERALELFTEERNPTPDMPYKKTDQWVGMAMRRAMQMAAQEGFDRVAWVTGEQSADRYDLGKQVDEIIITKRNPALEDKFGWNILGVRNGVEIISKNVLNESELSDVIGKELASKVVEDNIPLGGKKSYKGKDLRVGAKGMETFYNSILPKVTKKEAQRFDKNAKVEVVDFQPDTKIDIGEYQVEFDEEVELYIILDANGKKVHDGGFGSEVSAKYVATQLNEGVSFEDTIKQEPDDTKYPLKPQKQLSIALTPKMKENLSKGIPMFNKYQSPITVTTNGFYINENGLSKVYVNKDSNNVNGTNIHEYTHPYLEQLEKTNPEIYQKGEQLIEQELGKTKSEIQDIIDFVKRNQPNLQGRALINEILTQTIQQKGEEVINSKKKSNLKDWINEFLDWLKGKLGLTQYSNQEVLAMNLSEYSEAVAVDLLRGEELFAGNKAQEYYQRNADRLPLTLAVFERPEFVKMQGKMVKPITVLNSLNQSGIKQIEKELIRNIIEQNYQGQNKISYDELEATVRANIMPLERIFTSSYADYGIENLGDGNYGKANTIILNAPIEHGVTGHFSGDFEASGRKNIKYVPKQLNDNVWVAVEEGYESQGANQNNIYQFVGTAGTKEAVETWIKNYENLQSEWVVYTDRINENGEQEGEIVQGFDTRAEAESFWRQNTESYKNKGFTLDYNFSDVYSRREINKGMFAHIRVWQDGDTFYVAEAQSDFFQKNNARKKFLEKLENKNPFIKQIKEINKNLDINYFTYKKDLKSRIENSADKITAVNVVELNSVINFFENYGGNVSVGQERVLNVAPEGAKYVVLDSLGKGLRNPVAFTNTKEEAEEIKYNTEAVLLKNFTNEEVYGSLTLKDKYRIEKLIKEQTQSKEDYLNTNFKTELNNIKKLQKQAEEYSIKNLTKEEKQFIASQKGWEKRLLREALKEASLSGATKFRLPTPHTLATIEGYIQGEDGMPYEVLEADNLDRLKAGDTINFIGEEHTVIAHGYDFIQVSPSSYIEKVDGEVVLEEQAVNSASSDLYEFESLIENNFITQEEWDALKYDDNFPFSMGDIELNDVSREMGDTRELQGYKIEEKIKQYYLDNVYTDVESLLEEYGYENVVELKNGEYMYTRPAAYSEILKHPEAYERADKESFNIEDMTDTEQTVLRKYEELSRLLEEERGEENVETITDENGFDWYETKLSPEEINKPVVAFSQQQAGITIEEAIKRNNGNPLNLAPNGKLSILYKSYQDSGYEGAELDALVSQVYSDEFLGWFGDWINDPQNSSKVVDENGQPLMVFHGSPSYNITEFDRSKQERNSSGLKEYGVYFTTNKNLAKDVYAKAGLKDKERRIAEINELMDEVKNPRDFDTLQKELDFIKTGRVYPTFLNLKSIKTFDAEFKSNVEAWNNLEVDAGYKMARNRDAMEFLKNGDFGVEKVDGIKAQNALDMNVWLINKNGQRYQPLIWKDEDRNSRQYKDAIDRYGSDVYLVFDGNETAIKSATQNIGTFDSTNPDIRFQKELTLQETDYDLMIEDMIEKGEITQNCKL